MRPDTFPRQHARTRRFTLGEPRDLVVSSDGERLVFARSRGGSDPVNCLWVADLVDGGEHLVADPDALLADAVDDLPPEERARRERAREAAGGVTSFATDADAMLAAFALGGRLFVADLGGLHQMMGWDGPILTDSGGFQVFSLAELRTLDEDRVVFKSHVDGSLLELTPASAIRIQEQLGADCIMCLDECPAHDVAPERLSAAVDRTIRWAALCRDAQRRDDQALFGPGSLGLDSVDALQLVVALDKNYGLKIPDPETARKTLHSVNSIAAAVQAHVTK